MQKIFEEDFDDRNSAVNAAESNAKAASDAVEGDGFFVNTVSSRLIKLPRQRVRLQSVVSYREITPDDPAPVVDVVEESPEEDE